MRVKKIVTILLLLLVKFNIQANVYYVATNGNDINSGTETLPWKTIQKAANTLIAGDTALIKSGTYNERVIIQNSGSPNNFIVFSNYQNDNVIVDGNGISWGSTWNGLFDISGKNYIQVEGLTVMNADYGGIWVENSDQIVIRNNYTYNSFSSGIGVWYSSNITIENNEVELACNDGEQECITIANSNNCEISKNNVHDNGLGTEGGEGIDIKEGSHDVNVFQNEVHHLNNRLGIYADAWDLHTYNINFFQNRVHHCSEAGIAVASENGGLIENVIIYNNIVYNNKYDGIELGAWSDIGFTGVKPIKDVTIINNTCYNNGAYDNGWAYGINIDNPDAQNVIIRNNICSENSAQIAIQQIGLGGVVDHNLIFGNNTASGTLTGSDSIIGDPLFINPIQNDFHLMFNSPAIDTGSSINAPNFDFDSLPRPNNGSIDVGAYEFNPMLSIQDTDVAENRAEIYPNPFSDRLFIQISTETSANYTIQLFDLNGKLMDKNLIQKVSDDLIVIDRNNLVSGFYILNLMLDNEVILNRKLIIE